MCVWGNNLYQDWKRNIYAPPSMQRFRFLTHAHNKSFTVHYAYTITLTVHVLKCAYVFTTCSQSADYTCKMFTCDNYTCCQCVHVSSAYLLDQKRIPFSTLAKYGICGGDFQCNVLLNQELSLHQIELRLWVQFLANPLMQLCCSNS